MNNVAVGLGIGLLAFSGLSNVYILRRYDELKKSKSASDNMTNQYYRFACVFLAENHNLRDKLNERNTH